MKLEGLLKFPYSSWAIGYYNPKPVATTKLFQV